MTEATFTFRVEEDLKSAFNAAAEAGDRSAEQILREFMRDYIDDQQDHTSYDTWFRQQVEIGLAAANAGQLIPAEEVEAEFAARRQAIRTKLGGQRS
jgi:predicted transcriptional regulator